MTPTRWELARLALDVAIIATLFATCGSSLTMFAVAWICVALALAGTWFMGASSGMRFARRIFDDVFAKIVAGHASRPEDLQ